jgi:hypothetical protein
LAVANKKYQERKKQLNKEKRIKEDEDGVPKK